MEDFKAETYLGFNQLRRISSDIELNSLFCPRGFPYALY